MFRPSSFYRMALVALAFSVEMHSCQATWPIEKILMEMHSCPATRPINELLMEELTKDMKDRFTQPLPRNHTVASDVDEPYVPMNASSEITDIPELKREWLELRLNEMEPKIKTVVKLLTEEKFDLFFCDPEGTFSKHRGYDFNCRNALKIDNAFKAIPNPSPQQIMAHEKFRSHHRKISKSATEEISQATSHHIQSADVSMKANLELAEIAELKKKWLALPYKAIESKIAIVLKLLTEKKFHLFFCDEKGSFSINRGYEFNSRHAQKIDNAFNAIPNPLPQQIMAHKKFRSQRKKFSKNTADEISQATSHHIQSTDWDAGGEVEEEIEEIPSLHKPYVSTNNNVESNEIAELKKKWLALPHRGLEPKIEIVLDLLTKKNVHLFFCDTTGTFSKNTGNTFINRYALRIDNAFKAIPNPSPQQKKAHEKFQARHNELCKSATEKTSQAASRPIQSTDLDGSGKVEKEMIGSEIAPSVPIGPIDENWIAESKKEWLKMGPFDAALKIEIVLKLLTEEKFYLFFCDDEGTFNKKLGDKFNCRYALGIDSAFNAILNPSPQQKKAHEEFRSHHKKIFKTAPEKSSPSASSHISKKRKSPDDELSFNKENRLPKRLKLTYVSNSTTTTMPTTTTVTMTHQQ